LFDLIPPTAFAVSGGIHSSSQVLPMPSVVSLILV
jgi:hypothetical protein